MFWYGSIFNAMFIYTYLKDYFYFVYYFKLRRALPAHNISMLCRVVFGWQGSQGMPGGDFHQRNLECRRPVTEQTWLLAVGSTRWDIQSSGGRGTPHPESFHTVAPEPWTFWSLLSMSSLGISEQKFGLFAFWWGLKWGNGYWIEAAIC